MATHSSILAWKIPWTEEPGGLQSMESQRVGKTDQRSTHAPTRHSPGALQTLPKISIEVQGTIS